MIAAKNWLLWVLWAVYLICLFFSFQQLVVTCQKSKWKKNIIKKSFLFFLTIFLLFRTVLSIIPFPIKYQWELILFVQQLPRYIVFLAWQMLGLWIGNAVYTYSSKTVKYAAFTFFIIVYIVLFVLMIIVSPILCVCCFYLSYYINFIICSPSFY